MKDAPLHSYPWYVADWRGSETRITLPSAAKYVYRELLDYCWIEGSMPTDEPALARIAAVEIKEFRSLWPLIKDKFSESNGRLTHWRVLEKRPKLQSWANSRVKGGETGGRTKAANLAKPVAIASRDLEVNPLPPLTLPLPSVPSVPSVKQTPPQRTKRHEPEPFDGPDPTELVRQAVEQCAEFWPNIGDKRHAAASWEREAAKSTKGVMDWCTAIVYTAKSHAFAQVAAKAQSRKHFIPTLDRWVSSGDYTSPPPKVIHQQYGPVDLGENLDGRT